MSAPELSREPISGSSGWFAVEYEPSSRELILLDQRFLPSDERYSRLKKPDEVAEAIRDMVVRGAPAIGISAAYALALQAGFE
ncbi:MAG: S-methyl-5-thioribose-1-phosphate isomerase, partial [Myxococcota bacterium]